MDRAFTRSTILSLVAVTLTALGIAAQTPREPTAKVVPVRARPLGFAGGVEIGGDGFGSSLARVPGRSDEFYGLSDRGPNVDGPQADSKVFPLPQYAPTIARIRFVAGAAEVVDRIPLRDERGVPLNGLPPRHEGATGELPLRLDGRTLDDAPNGVDPEGLVALADGTFWIAEEYAPSLLHVASDGRLLERITPFATNANGHRLPPELARRVPNRGIEALTVTPDGRSLVFLMQNAIANGVTNSEAKATAAARLVVYTPTTEAVRTYLYLLDNPAALGTLTSEIAALTDTEFLVLEHDVHYASDGSKRKAVFEISLRDATDVARANGPRQRLDAERGLLVDGNTIERWVATLSTMEATARLADAGIRPVSKRLVVDLNLLLLATDPSGRFFAHDKVEGIAVLDGGRRLVLSNDSDFGVTATRPQSTGLAVKIVPATGKRDVGELLVIDLGHTP